MNIAVIFAGGVGSRMKIPGKPKQFLEIAGKPIIVHTLENFQNNSLIDKIVVVMLSEYLDYMNELVHDYHLSKVACVVSGGKTGQESIYLGLCAAKEISQNYSDTIVLIHDGVRPIIEDDLISRNILSVKEYGSAISSVGCKETVIQLENSHQISDLIDRSTVWLARAPQSFYLKDILDAHEKARKEGKEVIDSCSMMLWYGKKCHIVQTVDENIKVTTSDDFYIVERLFQLKDKEN